MATPRSFEIVSDRGDRSPLVAHVPHVSTFIPPEARELILLTDAALGRELARMTDWHTEDLFSWVLDLGGSMFVNRVSRLVMDPERFADDADEPMSRVGQGVVYTKTADGEPLSRIDPSERERRVRDLYWPYHAALTELVASILDESGRCTILDCHSFPSIPLPSEKDKAPDRPDICIGTDEYHTPPALADVLEQSLAREGFRVGRNSPFGGSLVPLRYWRKDPRVTSVMIEVRRDLYCDEATGERAAGYNGVREAVRRGVAAALGTWSAEPAARPTS
jgi:N-formylglutamate amidohydrolase